MKHPKWQIENLSNRGNIFSFFLEIYNLKFRIVNRKKVQRGGLLIYFFYYLCKYVIKQQFMSTMIHFSLEVG